MVLGERGYAGIGRFEDETGDRALRRHLHRNPRSERCTVEHDPAGGDPLALQENKAGLRIGVEAGLARAARVAAIAAVAHQQDAIPLTAKALQPVGAVADIPAIAMKIKNDRPALA